MEISDHKEVAKIGTQDVMTEAQREVYHAQLKRLAKRLGLNEDGEHPGRRRIDLNSTKYPEHMFKIGYFRSSYNSGGINHVLRDMIGKDLYDVFIHTDDEYEFAPDWNDSKLHAEALLDAYRKKIAETGGVSVMEIRYGLKHNNINSVQDALASWQKKLEERKSKENQGFDSFGCLDGEFFMKDPLKVVAIMPGAGKRIFGNGDEPRTYVLYKGDDNHRWYEQALEVVIETIDWVLEQKAPGSKFMLHWSA